MTENERSLMYGDAWDYDPLYQEAQAQLFEQRLYNLEVGKSQDYGTEKYKRIINLIRNGYKVRTIKER